MKKTITRGIKRAVEILGQEVIDEINDVFREAEKMPVWAFAQVAFDCMNAPCVVEILPDEIRLSLMEEIVK